MAKDEERVKRTREKRPLECQLTEQEVKQHAKNLAEAIRHRAEVEDQIDSFKAQKKAEIAELEAQIKLATNYVNSEKEYRMVELEKTVNYTTGFVTVVRIDSGEIIETRAISGDEKQTELEV